MAKSSSDEQLAHLLGDEPPRKRRAAALAAQKNWQLLDRPDDELTEDDVIIVTQKDTFVKPIENKINYLSIVSQNSPKTQSMPSLKRTSAPNNAIIIDMLANKPKRNSMTVDTDTDYMPSQDSTTPVRGRPRVELKKTTTTPVRTVYSAIAPKVAQNVIQNANQNLSRLRGQELIHIESEQSNRVIVRSNPNQYRKPIVIKLHPNEPLVLPTVEDDVEEIVGTYEVDGHKEQCNGRQNEESISDLEMNVFCDSDDKPMDESSDKNESDIEVIEIISNKEVAKVAAKAVVPPKSYSSRREKPLKSHLDSIIGSLEMECESFDDEFTDGLSFDCEEDILTTNQWNQSVAAKKEYTEYAKAVISTKVVKFLPENEVTEAIGVVTTTVSETTKIISVPTRTPVRSVRTRQQNTQQISQSIRAPIPSTINRVITSAPTVMTSMPPITVQNQVLNGLPITLYPISSSAGVTSPLILAPATPNIVSPIGLPPGVRLILSPDGANQTYIMIPRSNAGAISAPNVYLSNPNTIYQHNPNMMTTNITTPRIRLTNPSQPRFRAAVQPPYSVAAPPPYTSAAPQRYTGIPTRMRGHTAYRSAAPRPVVSQYNPVVNRFPIANQTLSVAKSSDSNQTINQRTDPLFDCLTVLKGTQNSSKKINMRNVLTIKPLPFSWPSNIDDLISSLIKLDNALMKEKFKESPIAWMVSAQLITPPKCKVCQKGVCNQVNKTQNQKNEYWQCNNQRCNTSYVIDRPRIFSGVQFDMPVSKLLFIIYYWSIQVDVEDLIKTGQIEMSTEKIFNVWQQLQKVCSFALKTKDSKLGSGHRDVEIATIQVGRFHVLGAMEAVTHRTKLCVVPITSIVQQNGKQTVLMPFIKWLERGTTIRTTETKFTALRDHGFKVVIQSRNEFLANNKTLSLTTIGGYLIHHLQRFFKDFDLSTLNLDILSNILEELLWRERYGTNPFSAFYNIIKHISEQCGLRRPEQNANVQIPTPVQVRALNSNQNTYSPAPNRVVIRTETLNDSNSVFVDEYYYSSLNLKTNFTKNISQEEESPKDRIQCHLCQMFFDNILLVKHLLEHLEKERRGRVRKGDNNESECKHCLRFFNNRTLHMHDELANLKLIPYSCRICALPFYARHPFIQHMKTCHFSGEMPYYCDICSYRSSFQKNLLDHFEASHSDLNQVMCPFCIRIFDLLKFKNLSQFIYRHLATHYAVASVYDCEKCVLTFTTKIDLKEHSFKGHNPSNAVDEKFEIIPYNVADEDKQLCIRAKEQELFTPNLPTFGSNSFDESAANTEGPEGVSVSCEVDCEPNIADFLSIEPECQISLTDPNSSFENFILPVDCDYSDLQLRQMLAKSFDISADPNKSGEDGHRVEDTSNDSTEANVLILSNDRTVTCFECNTFITTHHFISRRCCEKCNFTTHCKTAFDEHTSGAHSAQPEPCKQSSVLNTFSKLIDFDISCKDCDFTTKDGNQMALHMINSNHFNPLCKSLSTSL